MTPREVLNSLIDEGFTLTATNGTLWVAPKERLTDLHRTTIRRLKLELLKELHARRPLTKEEETSYQAEIRELTAVAWGCRPEQVRIWRPLS